MNGSACRRETRVVRIALATLCFVALAAVAPLPAYADAEVTLNGESAGGSTTAASFNCDQTGSGEITYSVEGTAEGPYPGTFSETGTIEVSNGIVVSFSASFAIDGPTSVEGTKSLAEERGVTCATVPPEALPVLSQAVGSFSAHYDATISSPAGTLVDHGIAGVGFNLDRFVGGPTAGGISESFISDREGSQVVLSPAQSVNVVGTTHTVTVLVQDSLQRPIPGAAVLFTVEGSVSQTGRCTTGPDGTCEFTYLGPDAPGADLITGCYDFDNDGTTDPGERCGTATKAWEEPTSTPGQVGGGGYITSPSGSPIVFGFGAHDDQNGPSGRCNVIDQAADTRIRCLSVSSLVIVATHATLSGEATVNGVATNYRIDVDDFGNPGALNDTFKIETDSGYAAGGLLTAGNVNVNG